MGDLSSADRPAIAVKDDLRSVMRTFATGVCVVSTYSDTESTRRHNALTVNSLTSLSLDPPLVALSIRRDSTFVADLLASRVWALSILDGGGEDLARIFARPAEEREKALRSLPAEPGEHTGALLLDSAAWLECRLHDQLVTGDHLLFVGEVVGAGVRDSRSALTFLHGKFRRVDQHAM
ncbi:flavin reductase family protein [Streptomyces sp. NPDC090025]|uniref:flavin reductase family protein n=1 Tax=Streptomyces sp. NPDC090025 TaxID=3365922 RepID=UPI0038374AB9